MPGPVPDDLTQIPAVLPKPARKTTRRETILSLVEALLAEEGSKGDDIPEGSAMEDDHDVPTVAQRLQKEGAEVFKRFEKRINCLDKELRSFANASRQLGSSVGILASSFHLRTRLAQVLFLFRQNASDLFPTVQKQSREPIEQDIVVRKRRHHKHVTRMTRPSVDETMDLEEFPNQLEILAKSLTTFLSCLNEFPEFTDDGVNLTIKSFEADLKYWASCLREYEGQFRYPAVQRYVHDLGVEMGCHLDDITSALSMFIEIGVPTIRFAQKHGATNLLNLSTVATFFSAVTATTMQFSFEMVNHPVENAVNGFWFASLVFSIGAAVNSLLGLTWKQALYRSPGDRVPWWVLIWIKRSPLVFLVLSVACFSIGLCCFAYASGQHQVTCTLTTVLTAFTSFGLAAVSLWFASERYIYLTHKGEKWLDDVLDEIALRFLRLPGMPALTSGLAVIKRKVNQTAGGAYTGLSNYLCCRSSVSCSDIESGTTYSQRDRDSPEPGHPGRPSGGEMSASGTLQEKQSQMGSPVSPSKDLPDEERPTTPPSTPDLPSEAKQHWQNAIRRIRLHNTIARPITASPRAAPNRKRTTSTAVTSSQGGAETPVTAMSKSRVATLQPKLNCLDAVQDLSAHGALVRNLQFSPNGKYLATASWDRTAMIWNVGKQFTVHRTLAHAKGLVGQVAWSPAGDLLLTKVKRDIKVWTLDGVCKKTIPRPRNIESLTWCHDGASFVSVERCYAVKLDLSGNVQAQYEFDRLSLHDVAVVDEERLLGVGALQRSRDGRLPSKSREEKRLVVYNMVTQTQENQTPVLNDVRDITIARNRQVALVSYEHKAPPQLWKVELVRDQETKVTKARLTLRHTYMPKVTVDFAGPSYFGGIKDEMVLCAGKGGDIHIWDTESASLLRYVRAQQLGSDLTCIGWNHAATDPFMFATGSHDGAVRIWTKPIDDEEMDSRMPSSGVPTRSTSPVDYLRTDSPLNQQDGTNSSVHTEDDSTSPLILTKDRVVAFADS